MVIRGPWDSVVVPPDPEDIGWRPEANRVVNDRRAAHALTLRDVQREIGGELDPVHLPERREHVHLALVEVGGPPPGTALHDDHPETPCGELVREDRARCAGTDDAHVRRDLRNGW